MTLTEKLINTIRQHIHGSNDLSLPLPIVGAQVCSSYHEGQPNEFVTVYHSANAPGEIFKAHAHKNDHVAMCLGGLVLVEIEGQDSVLLDHGGECLVPAGKKHRIIYIKSYLKDKKVIVKCVFPWGFY